MTSLKKKGLGVVEVNGDRGLSDDEGLTEDRKTTVQSGRADKLQAQTAVHLASGAQSSEAIECVHRTVAEIEHG